MYQSPFYPVLPGLLYIHHLGVHYSTGQQTDMQARIQGPVSQSSQ